MSAFVRNVLSSGKDGSTSFLLFMLNSNPNNQNQTNNSSLMATLIHDTDRMSSYKVNITPIIKVDIKDGKIRITYTLQYYNIEKVIGGGIIAAFSDGTQRPEKRIEKWGLETCFPFIDKDKHKAKKTSSKALVMAHAYSNVIMDKIEEAVKNGLAGNEDDAW